MASQGDASNITQDSPKRLAQGTPTTFTPKPRKPRMDARSYKKLFVRREVQLFKVQVVQRVVQVLKTQDQELQEEGGQNF